MYYVFTLTYVIDQNHSEYEKNLEICLTDILENCPLFLLELAILLNITKWIYFILALKAHRNIAHYDISRKIFAEREGHSTLLPIEKADVQKSTFRDN